MKCWQCHASGYCAVDCTYAPWNVYDYRRSAKWEDPVERVSPYAPSPFAYIMRFRRWLGRPPDRRDVHFQFDRGAQSNLGRNFWSRE